MKAHRPLTRLAHELLAAQLHPGEPAIDATAGNGHDTLFLARQVGPSGGVHAFDIQSNALEKTRERLQQAGCRTPVALYHASHADMLSRLPPGLRAKVAAITLNLGYLPGSDHHTITQYASTLQALEQSLTLLRPGGVLSILAYRGHSGGPEEARAVAHWCERQTRLEHRVFDSPGPILHFCRLR